MATVDLPGNENNYPIEEGYEHIARTLVSEAYDHLHAAEGYDAWNENQAYLQHDSMSLRVELSDVDPVEAEGIPVVVILLTRDGKAPLYQERKELIHVSFPATEDGQPLDQTKEPLIWVEYTTAEGVVTKTSVTHDGIMPYRGDLREAIAMDKTATVAYKITIKGLIDEIKRQYKVKRSVDSKLDLKQLRDLISGFQLTPHNNS